MLVNGLAYNSQDGYMYAVTYPNSTTIDGTTSLLLYRVGFVAATPTAVVVATTTLPKGVKMATGTFDKAGNYFLSGENTQTNNAPYANTLYRIKPGALGAGSTAATTIAADPLALRNAGDTGAAGVTCYDIAFNPVNGKIYGVNFPGALYEITGANATTNKVLVTTYGTAALNEPLGSAIFDVSGALYAYSNGNVATANSGKFYKINVTTADGTVGGYTQLSSIDPAAISDGASCINPGNALDVVMSAPTMGTPISPTTFDVTYTIQIKNSGTSADPNVQVTDFLLNAGPYSAFPGASSVTTQSLTIVNNTPTAGAASTLAVNSAFTGTTDKGVNANLLTTNQTLAVGQSAIITLKVRVVYPTAASVPLTAQNNTVYATSTADTNPGYAYVTNGTVVTLVPPDNLEAYDLSTNSATLPGLVDADTGAHGDAPSPTPVIFPPSVSGVVFEDVNYGGGSGRPFDNTAGTVARANAKVELYDGNGALKGTTTTDTNGNYAFQNLAAGTYSVRVVNSTVTSSRTGYTSSVLAVQTFVNGDANRVGGAAPAKTDAAANSGSQTLAALTAGNATPESVTSVTLGAAKADVDFGYNFDTVVNTNDSGQGSLRQFVLNANTLGGEASLAQAGSNRATLSTTNTALPAGQETSIFMIPDGQAHAGLTASAGGGPASQLTAQDGQKVAIINLASTLTLSGPKTNLDATTQTVNVGDTNSLQLGTGGTVGATGTTLDKVNGPEVQLVEASGSTVKVGINVTSAATGNSIAGLAIYGFGSAPDTDDNADILVAASGLTVSQNILGTTATSFADPGASRTNADHIRITGPNGSALGSLIGNNLIGFGNGSGVTLNGGVSQVTIRDNEISGNSIGSTPLSTTLDGVTIKGSAVTVTGNLIANNGGNGVDAFTSTGSNPINNNTVAGNGTKNGETAGVRLNGSGNAVGMNVISGNYGAGIQATSGTSNSVFSQNSISGNGAVPTSTNGAASGEIGIDLQASGNANDKGTSPFVTLNDNGDGDTGANGLTNMPVIQSAIIRNGSLVVTGFAKAGALLEFFIAAPNAASLNATGANFGQGQAYLVSRTEGSTASGVADQDATTGTYSGNVNGFGQGSETGQNRFSFSIPLTNGTLNGQAISSSSLLTSTATVGSATSEFSGNARVLTTPVPNDATNATLASNALTPVVLNPNLSATATGFTGNVPTQTANSIASYTVNPPSSGTLFYNNVPVTAATVVTAATLSQLTYRPAFGFVGNATFSYTATDANNTESTTHNGGGTVTDGAATYTIPVAAAADVTTTITGPAALNAGQPSGTYTAAFTNNGPQVALAVAQAVALPNGAIVSATQQTAITTAYAGTTFATANGVTTITFPAAATLAAGASVVRQFAFTAPTAATTTASLTSTTSTTSDEGANAAPDVATLSNVAVNGVADVATTITAAATSAAAGGTATFTAAFSNVAASGPQPAAGVVGKVQLPLGLANVTTSGGTYDAATGVITYNIGTLTSGQSATSLTITYTQPANGSVTAASAVSTTTNEAGQTGNNAAQVTIAPTTTTDVATTIGGPATATVGTQVTYNVTTANAGTGPASAVAQTVTLPSGAANIYVTGGGVVSGSTVTFPTIGTLAAGQSVNNTVSFTAPNAASFNAVANVTATNDAGTTGNNTATATTTTAAAGTGTAANLYTKISTPTPNVTAGTAVTFTVTQGNQGPGAAASVVSRVALPTGLPTTGAAALKLNGSAPSSVAGTVATYAGIGTYDSSTGLATFTALATQGSDATPASYTLTFNAPASGAVTATASVASTTPDAMMGNNVASAEVTVDPAATDLATALTGPDAATPGQRVSYTVTTTNNGPAAATGISQVVEVPAGLPLAGPNAVTLNGSAPSSVAGTVATYAGIGTYDSSTGLATFTATANAQTAGGSASNAVAYNVPANGNASLVNTARVSAVTNDSNPANNVAPVVTTIQPSADVQVAITGPATAVLASATLGAPVTYGVTTTNNGPSVAGSVATTVQLPTGLASVTVIGYDGATLTNSTTTGYSSADGIVRFPAVANQASGAAAASSGSISLVTPANVNILTPTATAVLTGTAADPIAANNSATAVTTLGAPTAAAIDLAVAISRSAATVAAGAGVSFTVTTTNNSTVAGGAGAVTTVQLPAGLATTGTVALTNSGTYDNATGLATFTAPATNLAAGASIANTITISQAPGAGPLVATAAVRGPESDLVPANNTASTSVAITAVVDVATTVAGPATAPLSGPVTYTVTTTANGPSPAASVQQQVVLPAGIVSYSVNGGTPVQTNGGSASTGPTTVTLTVPANLAAGPNNTVANTVSFSAPANATNFTYNVTASVTATGDAALTGNNTATVATARYSQPPVATNVTNTLQAPQDNTATAAMQISPLAANSALGTIQKYNLTSVPPTAQGVLYYNANPTGTASYQAITTANYAALNLSPTQAGALRFLPASGYVGNAAFTYTATDNNGALSNAATYLVPVAQDLSSTYTVTPTKGGNANKYAAGDVLAYGLDPNAAQYNSAGLVYSPTGGAPASGTGTVSNGIAVAKISAADSTKLASYGILFTRSTGLFTVSNPALLPRAGVSLAAVTVTSTGLNGGVNTNAVALITGANPLPVELVAFTAKAVQNRDAQLAWTTASEKNNDHFDVERSLDGTSFVKIGQVAGQGSKSSPTDYALTDANAAGKATGGVAYYRLRQVDADGTASYSPVQSVRFAKTAALAIGLYPNPATTAATLDLSQLPAGTYAVGLLDATGRTVLATRLAAGLAHALDLVPLASGSYVVRVAGTATDGTAVNLTQRLVKE